MQKQVMNRYEGSNPRKTCQMAFSHSVFLHWAHLQANWICLDKLEICIIQVIIKPQEIIYNFTTTSSWQLDLCMLSQWTIPADPNKTCIVKSGKRLSTLCNLVLWSYVLCQIDHCLCWLCANVRSAQESAELVYSKFKHYAVQYFTESDMHSCTILPTVKASSVLSNLYNKVVKCTERSI